MIKSVSFSQEEILKNIIALHTGPIDCDVTYGGGCFYKKDIPQPVLCLDIAPQFDHVLQADVQDIPLPGQSQRVVMFDPPFMLTTGPGAQLKDRFGSVIGSMADLWDFYRGAMAEIRRILIPGGWLIFKCQDGVLSGKNHFSHVEICTAAQQLGFVPVDLFILLARHRMVGPKNKTQRHARKYHSYFWVLRKQK